MPVFQNRPTQVGAGLVYLIDFLLYLLRFFFIAALFMHHNCYFGLSNGIMMHYTTGCRIN